MTWNEPEWAAASLIERPALGGRVVIDNVRSIAASEKEEEKPKVNANTLDRLEEEYNRTIILLKSGRRTLRLWKRGMAAWLTGVITGAGLIVVGIGSIVTGDFHTLWGLLVSGSVLEGAAAPGAFWWVIKFRLNVEKMSTGYSRYGESVKVPATTAYVDPAMNVELRELQYVAALRKLSHGIGTDPNKDE